MYIKHILIDAISNIYLYYTYIILSNCNKYLLKYIHPTHRYTHNIDMLTTHTF